MVFGECKKLNEWFNQKTICFNPCFDLQLTITNDTLKQISFYDTFQCFFIWKL